MRSSATALVAIALVSLPAMLAQVPDNTATKAPAAKEKSDAHDRKPVIRPMIPKADRHEPGKVFVEYADRLDKPMGSEAQVLIGNVQFRKGDMFMYCDSALFYEENSSLEAYNNVRMEQGDTLFVYSDELYYDGMTEIAELRAYPGRNVRLINRDVTLTTPVFFYDIPADVGYYMVGGTLDDKTNTLVSRQGYYYPSTKDAFFYLDVDLTGPQENDTLKMYTDSLTYNTDTGMAQLMCKTLIVSKDGEITSTSGFYDTRTGIADLYERSMVHTRRGNTLTGDTLFYDRDQGFGEAFGNMVLTDSAKQSSLLGDYGYYDEFRDSAFVTGNALAMEYSGKDTLYLHGDTITAYMVSETPGDTTKITNAFHRVRFFRNDIQGLCDSMSMVERDSILYMYYNPILWYGDKQIVGNVIYAHFNDSTVDWARLPESGVLGQHIGEDCYDQLAGSDMTAWFNDSTIRRLYVEGNVQVIMFPMENDSTYNKFVFTESSTMDAYFNGNEIEKINMWPETTGKATPLYLAKRSAYYLPMFRWYAPLRPMAPAEVFDYPAEMADLKAQKLMGKIRPDAYTVRGTATGRPRPLEPERTALSATLPADSLPADSLQPGSSIGLPDSLGIPEPVALPDSIEIPEPADQPEPSAPVDPAPEAPETPDVPEAPSAPTPDAPGTTDIYRKEVIS